MNKFEKKVVGYTALCHGSLHTLELAYGTLLVSIAFQFEANLATMGILANIMGFFFGAVSVPTGWLADRKIEKTLLTICALGMGISAIITGLAPNIIVLGAGLLMLGMAMGIYHPVSSSFISRVVRQRGMGFGLQGIGGNIGLALSPILASTLATLWGWRSAYLIFSFPPLLTAALFFLTLRKETGPVVEAVAGLKKEKVNWSTIILSVFVIFSMQIFIGFIYRALVTFLPLYLGERIQLSFLNSVAVGGIISSIILGFGVIGQFTGGYLSERFSREGLLFILLAVSIPLLLIMGSNTGLILVLSAATFAFFHFMGQPVGNVLLADYSPPAVRGRIFGLFFFFNFGVGSFSASLLGYLGQKHGVASIFIASAGFAALALVCITYLWLKAQRMKKQALSSSHSL